MGKEDEAPDWVVMPRDLGFHSGAYGNEDGDTGDRALLPLTSGPHAQDGPAVMLPADESR